MTITLQRWVALRHEIQLTGGPLLFAWVVVFFFFQAEDGIRDQPRSRGLGDVYKRQDYWGISV